MAENILRISDGALIVQSKMPCGCDLERSLEEDIAWIPKLLIAIPDKDNPFIVDGNSIKLENTPYHVKREGGLGVWYMNENVSRAINSRGYAFVPGNIGERESIYNFSKSFIPDERDINQKRLDVNLLPDNSFMYSESVHHRNFVANVRVGDLPNIIYSCLFTPGLSRFGYDCRHSGEIGLATGMNGKMESSMEQKTDAVRAIEKDLKEKLDLKFGD